MSLMPRINFPINFYFWEGSFPSSKETKGRREEEEGKKKEEGEGGRQRCGPVLPFTFHMAPPLPPWPSSHVMDLLFVSP